MNPKEASQILKEGMVISTKLVPTNTWDVNIVYKCEGNVVVTGLLETYLEKAISVGSKITFKYTNDFFEYNFEGVVKKITANYPSMVYITIKNAIELVNTRSSIRYDTCIATMLSSLSNPTTDFSIVTNLSIGGMALVCKKKFEYGDDISIVCTLSEKQMLEVSGRIIRRSIGPNFINYSIQFLKIDDENSEILKNYISSLEQKISHLKDYFLKNIKGNLN